MKKSAPPLSRKANLIKIGLYQHYKGNYYRLLGIGRHSETLEEFVIYHAVDGNQELWIRPLDMFCENVQMEGNIEMPRFSYIENENRGIETPLS